MKRFLSICMAMAMLVVMLAGCGEGFADVSTTENSLGTLPVKNPETTETTLKEVTTTVPAESTTEVTTEAPIIIETTTAPIEIPIEPDNGMVNFGGRTFTILSNSRQYGENYSAIYDNDRMDRVSQAIEKRNREIEANYHCRIVSQNSLTAWGLVCASVAANKDEYDLFAERDYLTSEFITSGNVLNLYSLDIDFENSYWNQNWVNTYTVNAPEKGKTLYSVTGAFSLDSILNAQVLFYDKTLFKSLFPRVDLESMVTNGTWTIDIFKAYVEKALLDSESVIENVEAETMIGLLSSDQYGTAYSFLASAGVPLVNNVGGRMNLTNNEIDSLYYAMLGAIKMSNADWISHESAMTTYQTVNAHGALFIASSIGAIADMPIDCELGILPYPKHGEVQKDYYSAMSRVSYAYAVPSTVTNLAQISNFFDIYACYSEMYVIPAFYEYYGEKYGSAEMIELIADSCTFDPAYHYWYDTLTLPLIQNIYDSKNTARVYAKSMDDVFDDLYAELLRQIEESKH